jgi:hypothetical protein
MSGIRQAADSSDSTSPAGKRSLLSALVPSGGAMQSFIHRKNLENYRKQLAETKDAAELSLLRRLLAEEEAKEPPAPRREDG